MPDTATITGPILGPDQTPQPNIRVIVELVAGPNNMGHLPAGEILGTWEARTDSEGDFAVVLPLNTEITPAGTYYSATVGRGKSEGAVTFRLDPASGIVAGGTYHLMDPLIVVSAPPAPAYVKLQPEAFNARGQWSASGTYAANDLVNFNGDSYVATAAVGPSATTPDVDTAHWSLFLSAASGAVFTSGDQTIGGTKTFTAPVTGPLRDKGGAVFDVRAYGAVGDALGYFAQYSMTSGSAVLTSAVSGDFSAADVGKPVVVKGAGASGGPLYTTVASFTSSTMVTLAVAASTSVSATAAARGTDDTAAVQAAIDAAYAAGGGCVFNGAACFITGDVFVKNNVTVRGATGGDYFQLPATGVFVCGSATARLRFGDGTSTHAYRGLSSDFTVLGFGGGDPTGIMAVLLGVSNRFDAIMVRDAVGDGILIEQSQNCLFTTVDSIWHRNGAGLVLDKGAATNKFLRCEFSSNMVGVEGKDTHGSFPSPYVFQNSFDTCIFENQSGSTADTQVKVVEGSPFAVFRDCIFSGQQHTSGHLVHLEATSPEVIAVVFDRCTFSSTDSDGIYAKGAVGLNLSGACRFALAAGNAALVVDGIGPSGALDPSVGAPSAASLFSLLNGANTNNFYQSPALPTLLKIDAALGFAQRIQVPGETGYRLNITRTGSLQFNDGTDFVPAAHAMVGAGKDAVSISRLQLGTGVVGVNTGPKMWAASAAPTGGAHAVGDVVFNAAPAAGGKIGWVCTTAGTPGTWKAFGAIDA